VNAIDPKNPLRSAGGFDRLYKQRAQAVLIFLVRRVLDAEVALDLTAETFAQAFLSRHRFRGRTDEEAAAWLYAIARHQLSHYLRRGRTERRAIERLGLEVPALSPEEYERVEELADLGSLRSAVADGLARISVDHREALELRVVRELSYPEVAQHLGISEQAARARVSRGLKALGSAVSLPPQTKESIT
jgi:RNA polymerase sigma factor (sigma-70 family)